MAVDVEPETTEDGSKEKNITTNTRPDDEDVIIVQESISDEVLPNEVNSEELENKLRIDGEATTSDDPTTQQITEERFRVDRKKLESLLRGRKSII